jgi:hypothetical protein
MPIRFSAKYIWQPRQYAKAAFKNAAMKAAPAAIANPY